MPLSEETAGLIVRVFDLPAPVSANLNQVRAFLTERIAHLMAGNMGYLMHILYRIDVDETRVKAILAFTVPAEIPSALADLVIERQLQKVEMRRRYKTKGKP